MNIFLNDIKKEYIKIFFRKKILTKLVYNEFNVLMKLLYNIIDYISVRFCFDPSKQNLIDIYWDQLLQNNHRDLIAIFNLLLPYIDDKEGTYILHNKIEYLSDISIKEDQKQSNQNDLSRNNYLISNIQYNLYNIDSGKKYKYGIIDIKQNYFLLLETIDRISNKLFINWLNIRPLTINNYKNSYLYKNSINLTIGKTYNYTISVPSLKSIKKEYRKLFFTYLENFKNNNINETDLLNGCTSINIDFQNLDNTINNELDDKPNMINKGISIGDVFNTIYHDLFYDIYKIKWLIFQGTFSDPEHDQIYIEVFNNLIAVPELYLGIKWNEMTKDKQLNFFKKWESYLELISIQDTTLENINHYIIMLQKIIVSMETNYDLINSIVSHFGYKKISKIDDETNMFVYNDDDDDESQLNKVYSNFELVENVKLIPLEDVYNYLLSVIQEFICTWYGRNIIIQQDQLNNINSNDLNNYSIIEGLEGFKFDYRSYSEKSTNNGLQSTIPKILNIEHFSFHFPEKLEIKYKFFYNYAKTFIKVYNNRDNANNTETYYRQNWYELEPNEKKILIKFLNLSYVEAKVVNKNQKDQSKIMNLMSINKYYKRTYSKSNNIYYKNTDSLGNLSNTSYELFGEIFGDPNTIQGLQNYIGDIFISFIRDKLIDITFESHIYKGLLTEFVVNPDLTDNKNLGRSYEEKTENQFTSLKKHVFTPDNLNNYKNNAFYFLTNKTYGSLNEIHRGTKKNYFDLLTSEYRWYSFYSMDWVSQINFFHHYINNRVIYVTGATGQGKSTQIPKLFLYGLKMIDRKSNGKVICSQPRVTPTRDNTEQISWELGVPITEISLTKDKLKTYNGYIQYDTQDDSHIVENHNELKLKLVTDRKLYEEIRKYPIYKQTEKSHNENKTSDDIEFNIYKADNRDDIIIVDESHEHGINMDLILTIARDTIRINNSLKLVIVSATMSDDEYTYRRYYKEIDDNFSYPYNFFNPYYNFDRSSVDRRIHISAPGETTQHKVTDIYLEKNINSYQEAETLAYNKVMEIATDINLKGDILFFSLGTKEIIKLVKKINEELPLNSDFICLPFYSELPSKWTSIFNNISKNVREITVHRTDLYNEIFPDQNMQIKRVSKNTYKRVIIISTNIAEASITVNSLKYIVDTGYYISVSNDYINNEPIIIPKLISETSRIQRRGRVGRVSSGIVYYMYAKKSREHIKSEPKICMENIFLDLYNLSASNKNSMKENFILSSNNWTNCIYQRIDKLDIRNNISKNSPELKESKLVNNLLLKQYTYKNTFILSTLNLIYKKTHNITIDEIKNLTQDTQTSRNPFVTRFDDDSIFNKLSNRYVREITGYPIKEFIYDAIGEFYIVHPDELLMTRNLLTGEIIKVILVDQVKTIVTDRIISLKIHKYLSKCFSYNLFINNNLKLINNKIFLENLKDEFNTMQINYTKTNIGRIISNIVANLKFHEKDININWFMTYVVIYAYICNIDDLVIIMIALIDFSNYSLNGLNSNINFLKKYGSEDLEIYFNLAIKLYDFFKEFSLISTNIETMQFENEKNNYLKQKEKIKNNLINKQNYWNLDISFESYARFNILDNRNKLNSNINLPDYIKDKNKKSKISDSDIDKLFTKFISLGINTDKNSIIRFIRFYKEIKNQIDKLKNVQNIPTNSNDLLWFKYNIPVNISTNMWINVKKAFIYGFGIFNVAIYHPSSNIIFDINSPKKYYTLSQTSITVPNNFMVYLTKERNSMSIVINTDLETLAECTLYNYSPQKLINFDKSNITDTNSINNHEIFLNNKHIEILNQRNKFIGHLMLKHYDIDTNNKFNKLFKESNNLIEYIIKLWTTDFTTNTFGQLNVKQNTLIQNGGNNYTTNYKIKISKLLYILGKFNITIESYFNKLKKLYNKGYNIEIINDYIIIK